MGQDQSQMASGNANNNKVFVYDMGPCPHLNFIFLLRKQGFCLTVLGVHAGLLIYQYGGMQIARHVHDIISFGTILCQEETLSLCWHIFVRPANLSEFFVSEY